MNTHADKTQENKSQAVSAIDSQKKSGGGSTFQFVDNRPEAIAQRKLQMMADNNSAKQQRSTQKKENNTGLPNNLKTGVESLSGMSLDDVKVHRNSDKPAQLNAHGYAQGTDIHLAPGQEKHLPHEAWHVVQQKQGRVKPTRQMEGEVNINDDAGLEKEADRMGDQAMQGEGDHSGTIVQQKTTGNTTQLVSNNSSAGIVQLSADKGLALGTKVRITYGPKKGQTGVIQSEGKGGYKVLLSGKRMANQFEYRNLEVYVVPQAQEVHDTTEEPTEDTTVETTEETVVEPTEDTTVETTEETTVDTDVQVDVPDLSTLSGQVRTVVENDDWNNADLVESIGKSSWGDIKTAWEAIDHPNKQKLILVKLRGKPYDEEEDDVTSYEGWSDNFMGEQSGNKWGTETEGGGITLSLQPKHISLEAGAKATLKAALSYFKRTALMETDTHTLALDNVNDKIDQLLAGRQVSMPIEVASKPQSGAPDVSDKTGLLKEEGRTFDQWPALKITGARLAVKTGSPKAIDKFNEYFVTHGVNNICRTQKPQHVTKSGQEEDRLAMTNELKSTAANLDLGTRGKAGLSGKAKTSLELLRHSSMDESEVKAMEKAGHQMRNSLREKFKEQKDIDIKFADEELNGIIVPTTGVPREIGAYTLATPMTNAFPLLDKGGGKVTALREYR